MGKPEIHASGEDSLETALVLQHEKGMARSVGLTLEQKEHMALWGQLRPEGKQMAAGYIQALLDLQRMTGTRKQGKTQKSGG